MSSFSPSPRRRRLRVVVLLLAPLAGLLLVEFGLRVAHARGHLGGALYMAGARTRFDEVADLPTLIERSGTPYRPLGYSADFIINSRGLRTIEYEDEKAPGTRRVVVLGDSHSWSSGGMAFRDLWHSRLAASLAGSLDAPVELINLGMPAMGTDFELRMWQLEGRKLDADLVIVAFSVGTNFVHAKGQLADENMLDWFARRSLLVRLVRNTSRVRGAGELAAPADDGGRAAAGGVVREDFRLRYDRDRPKYDVETHHKVIGRRLVVGDLSPKSTRQFEAACARIEELLGELFADVRRCGAEPVLALIPDEHQLDEALRTELIEQLGRTAADYEVERPQRALGEICGRLDATCVDALAALRAEARERSMFNLRESHLNDLGHEVLAEQLHQAILEHGLLE